MGNIDNKAFQAIGYGLYVATTHDGVKDNGCIVNAVMQVSSTPIRIAVCSRKGNYTFEVIRKTGKLNINTLDESAPFKLFKHFGYQSGRDVDKFAGIEERRSENGLRILPGAINSWMSLEVEQYLDLDSHGMFICTVTEAGAVSDQETMSYHHYQKNVKPKKKPEKKKGYVCKVCGYVYEGEELPADFVCPLCKHGAEDFEPIQ